MRRLLVIAALVAGLAAATPAASAPVVAVQDDRIQNSDDPGAVSSRLDTLAATGVPWTRVDVLWYLVATARPADARDPGDPAYDWTRYDLIFQGLQTRGIDAVVAFHGTPAWATARGTANAAPAPTDAAAFAYALARRYRGDWPAPTGGVLPAIRRIGVWNEPNIDQFYSPQCHRRRDGRWEPISPRSYAALLTASYREIKSANPRAIVIGGEAGPVGNTNGLCRSGEQSSVGTDTFVRVLERTLRSVRPRPLDVWAQHLYPVGPPLLSQAFPAWTTLPRLIASVDRIHPKGRMPVYITETSYHTAYNPFHRYFVTERQQAAYLDETFAAATRNARVQIVVWFNLQDNTNWTGGLLRADGSRKPSYRRLQRLAGAGRTLPVGWRAP